MELIIERKCSTPEYIQFMYIFNEDYMIEYDLIQIYKFKENNSYQKKKISEVIKLIEFHPLYKNIFRN